MEVSAVPSFLFRLGRGCARHPVWTIAMWFLVAIAMFGASARFGDDLVDDFALPGVESQRGTDVLEGRFPQFAGASGRVVFHTDDGRIDDMTHRAVVEDSVDALGHVPDVSFVTDPYDAAAPTVSSDGHTAFATVQFTAPVLHREHYLAAEDVNSCVNSKNSSGVYTRTVREASPPL